MISPTTERCRDSFRFPSIAGFSYGATWNSRRERQIARDDAENQHGRSRRVRKQRPARDADMDNLIASIARRARKAKAASCDDGRPYATIASPAERVGDRDTAPALFRSKMGMLQPPAIGKTFSLMRKIQMPPRPGSAIQEERFARSPRGWCSSRSLNSSSCRNMSSAQDMRSGIIQDYWPANRQRVSHRSHVARSSHRAQVPNVG